MTDSSIPADPTLEDTLTSPIRAPWIDTTGVAVPVGRDRVAMVDASDVELVSQLRWRVATQRDGVLTYAVARIPRPDGRLGTLYMQRLIMNTPKGLETDHRNGDGLDNRRANLRVATASQNRANGPKGGGSAEHTSEFRGVSWDQSRSRWRAQIKGPGGRRQLGRFIEEEAAARAYDVAAAEAFGEFAWLNFPGDT